MLTPSINHAMGHMSLEITLVQSPSETVEQFNARVQRVREDYGCEVKKPQGELLHHLTRRALENGYDY